MYMPIKCVHYSEQKVVSIPKTCNIIYTVKKGDEYILFHLFVGYFNINKKAQTSFKLISDFSFKILDFIARNMVLPIFKELIPIVPHV